MLAQPTDLRICIMGVADGNGYCFRLSMSEKEGPLCSAFAVLFVFVVEICIMSAFVSAFACCSFFFSLVQRDIIVTGHFTGVYLEDLYVYSLK